jgi:hypothetical protein
MKDNYFIDYAKFAKKMMKKEEATVINIVEHPQEEKGHRREEFEKKVVKAQALVRGHLVREQFKPKLKA